jgi:hypothetical protein
MSGHFVGDVSVTRVTESCAAGFAPHFLFPDWDARVLEQHRALIIPECFDPAACILNPSRRPIWGVVRTKADRDGSFL